MIFQRIKNTFKYRFKKHAPLSLQLWVEVMRYWCRFSKYCASIHTDDDIRKMQFTLLRENHVIEKGMSMRDTRKGFGQEKVCNLLVRLEKYFILYGTQDPTFLVYPLSTIKSYILFQHQNGVKIPHIEQRFELLCGKIGFEVDSIQCPAGVNSQIGTDIETMANGDFSSLLYSRHSIRYFQNIIPSRDLIEKALLLASRTPSACNRQAWHTHIYVDTACHELLEAQGGCNGFYEDIPCCIAVTADMKGFLDYEPFQCYVDGGLYAMNLINALHYVGIGSIPLSCGFYSDKLLAIQREFDIPENEVMIVIIGCGYLTDVVKIAESTRKKVNQTNVFH